MGIPQSSGIDIIECKSAGTIPGLLRQRVERSPDAVAYSEFDGGYWRDFTWRQVSQIVERYRVALDQAGLASGDRVAILLPNCMMWVAFDIAAMANGLISVPLFVHDSAANISFILSHSDARLCLIESPERWQAIAPAIKSGSPLCRVWLYSDCDDFLSVGGIDVRPVAEVLEEADGIPGPLRCSARGIATLIHTSGTTGLPKGVMLSHHALLWDVEAVTEFIAPLTTDIFLSVLPLAHAFERSMGYHLAMMGGSRVVFARSIKTLREDLADVQPTVLIAVPRLYERFYEAILSEASQNPVKKRLVQRAAAIGWQRFEADHGRGRGPGLLTNLLLWPLLVRMVARPVLQAFGGRLRVAVSGGAPLSTKVSRFFIGLGLPLVEGYGLTEAAPVVTATTLEDNLPGSVGRPLRGIETRIGPEGELLVKSPALMQGYWQDAERSAATIDSEGWLHTGDLAEFRAGHLYIIGRLKDLIVLSTGKNVASAAVEAAIEADPLFDQCCAVGNGHAFIAALVVLNGDRWSTFARKNGFDIADPNEPDANAALLAHAARAMRHQPPFARVRSMHALLTPWTLDDGSLTPTLKIKRQVIEDRYCREIEALYAQQAPPYRPEE